MSELYICMYHYVRDLKHSRYPEIKGMDVVLFNRQIEYMINNFNIITMEDVINAIEQGEELPEKALLLTFDDGYVDNYTYVFPILEEYGIQGSFFIPAKTFDTYQLLDVNKIHYILASANIEKLVLDLKAKMDYYRGMEFEYPSTIELWNDYAHANRFDSSGVIFVKRMLQTVLPESLRGRISSELFADYVGVSEETLARELYMNINQIKTMKRNGMFIGVHGYDHYWLGELTSEKMQYDINRALDVMSEFIDRKRWVMNYPYGNYSQELIDYITKQGACLGLTTEARIAKIGIDSKYKLPRLDCNDFYPICNEHYI